MPIIKKPLLDVIFASEKRKNILLFLKGGPKEMEVILEYHNTSRQSLLPQMKILEEHYLIEHYKDNYALTTIGKLVVDEMTTLLSTLDVLDGDVDYWGTHNFDFIPPYLLQRINEIGKCNVISPSIMETYEESNHFYEASKTSQSVYGVTTFFHPNFADFFFELISHNVHLHFIITEDLLAKIKSDNPTIFKKLIDNSLVHFYVYNKEMKCASFTCNDYYTKIRPLKNGGDFDTKYILCFNPSALKWGKELFEYYLKDSVPLFGT
ncbi:hypothetical protein Mpsy_0628 [Methanolobus psychrophilus R15]|nr:hypothetical protein Mpsy_0628 [Methanolobus psychrophilus R15]